MQAVSYNTYVLKRHQLLQGAAMAEKQQDGDLPSHFEVIVLGTGLEESIVAAAASRNGHSVLHIDFDDYYGGDWAAFNFDGIQNWIERQSRYDKPLPQEDLRALEEKFASSGEAIVSLNTAPHILNVKQSWYVAEDSQDLTTSPKPECSADHEKTTAEGDTDETKSSQALEQGRSNKNTWTPIKVRASSRRFNLDLMPKLLFSRGSMVELLISSNISRYTEFKSITRVLTMLNGELEHVPSSRADVFSTKHISVVEKRILMKFLTFCVNFEEQPEKYDAFKDQPFKSFLKHEKLSENLIHFVHHSIAMVAEGAPCLDGLRATRKFLMSLGRFGNSPFLWSMYGAGELPQAFCRLCAVFGGTYYLGRSLDGLILDKNTDRVRGIISNNQRINCDKLVLPSCLCPTELQRSRQQSFIHREIALLADSILPHEKEQVTFLSLSPESSAHGSYSFIQEVGFSAAACPQGMYSLHATSASCEEKPDCEGVLNKLIKDPSNLVWSLSFDLKTERITEGAPVKWRNVFECNGPAFELDYDENIAHAEALFGLMYEGEDFLPRAPEPEEIIIGEEEQEPNKSDDPESSNASQDPEEPPAEEEESIGPEESQQATEEGSQLGETIREEPGES